MSDGIIPVNLNVKMRDGNYEKRTMYVQEGMVIKYGDKVFVARKDAKEITMDAKFYATLGGISQSVKENDPHNDKFYVLTNSDITDVYNHRHDEDPKVQRQINYTQVRLETGASLSIDPQKGNGTNLNPQPGSLHIFLKDADNKPAGEVSVFKAPPSIFKNH